MNQGHDNLWDLEQSPGSSGGGRRQRERQTSWLEGNQPLNSAAKASPCVTLCPEHHHRGKWGREMQGYIFSMLHEINNGVAEKPHRGLPT